MPDNYDETRRLIWAAAFAAEVSRLEHTPDAYFFHDQIADNAARYATRTVDTFERYLKQNP